MDIKYAVSMAAINDIAQHGGSRYLAGGAVGGGGHRGAKGHHSDPRETERNLAEASIILLASWPFMSVSML